MKRLLITTLISLSFPLFLFNQDIIYQDYFHGGVSCSGIDLFGQAGVIQSDIPIFIADGSNIKKVFLLVDYFNNPEPNFFSINDNLLYLNSEENSLSNSFIFQYPENNFANIRMGWFDITDYFQFIESNVSIETSYLFNNSSSSTYIGLYFIVIYENSSFEKTNIIVLRNLIDTTPLLNFQIENLNIIDSTKNVGLSLNSKSTCFKDIDGAEIVINNNQIGVIGGSDALGSWCSSFGNSYYQNGIFYGLSDDIPNNVVNGTDAIANIQPYLTSTNSVNIEYNYYTEDQINAQAPYSNILSQLFLTYTTTCAEFEAIVPENVEICQGDSTILQVTGGNAYEWQPQVGLSCYDCPNPTYNDTITRWYTVKINNNDSCSKTLPVHVKVLPSPPLPQLTAQSTLCSDSSGIITVLNPNDTNSYSLAGGVFQSESVFSGLAQGNYQIAVQNQYGCTAHANTVVGLTNPTQALFTATPTQGEMPLTVTFNNQSTTATNYVWHIADDTLYEPSPNYVFNELGEFTASLIAYDTYPWCSDTSEVTTIVTEYPFNIIIPSTYTSYTNSYQIYTSRVSDVDYTLFNAIGQQVYHRHFAPVTGYSSLWERGDVARGVYLYTIKVIGEDGTEQELKGRVLVI